MSPPVGIEDKLPDLKVMLDVRPGWDERKLEKAAVPEGLELVAAAELVLPKGMKLLEAGRPAGLKLVVESGPPGKGLVRPAGGKSDDLCAGAAAVAGIRFCIALDLHIAPLALISL